MRVKVLALIISEEKSRGSGGKETLLAEEKPNLRIVKKQRNQRKRQNRFDDDEKRVRNGDRPFTKVKRSNRDMLDQNELQTYASLEKMLHKAIFAIQQLKKKGNTNTSSPLKQQSSCQCRKGQMKNKTVVIKQTKKDLLPFKNQTKLKVTIVGTGIHTVDFNE
ncbi:hypothetical protein DY000_02038379 [Brassica cretica]|uniref:Uncharacterized protein n=1 Tax=Brassica cretica TaxID=69181 RepID=A0ABQ7BGZ0_BRACR|nr:hypothetical protein DY000_02038379 [Brassica cretica]